MMHVNGAPLIADRVFWRHHDELRETWQAKLLLTATGQMAAVVLSVLAHSYPKEAFIVLMKVCFPGFQNIRPPFYASAAKIMKGGEIAADLIERDGTTVRHALVFRDKTEMEGAFRTLADRCRLDDEDRVAMFEAVRKWVVADFRLDPNRTEAA